MRFVPGVDGELGETRIEVVSNCYTDALPLLRHLRLRGTEIDLKTQSLPLACAVLMRRYCGDQFEYQGLKIGGDSAEAIGTVLARPVGIANVDGINRTISTGEIDILCRPAADFEAESALARPGGTTPVAAIDWSGDFVDRRTRRSTGFAFGRYHTNAAFFADEVLVSIAIGLIHGRDRVRTLHVPLPPGGTATDYEPIVAGLRIAGITLVLAGAAATDARPARRPKRRSVAA